MKNRDNANAVTKMQEYIEDNIDRKITLHELGNAADYSPFYSAKIFKELTGKSPFEYIRHLRLSKAALRLRDEEKGKVIDVALDFVFDSHEGFTRAFKGKFGLTPKKYMKNHTPVKLFLPTPVNAFYVMEDDKSDLLPLSDKFRVDIIEFPRRKLILKRGLKANNYFEYVKEVGCEVWGELVSIKEALYEPAGIWLPKKYIKDRTSRYVQGVEVPLSYIGIVPEGFDIITLDKTKMMVFSGEPFDDSRFDEAIISLSEIIDSYSPEEHGYIWDDDNAPRFQLEPEGYRGYIEGRGIAEIKKDL